MDISLCTCDAQVEWLRPASRGVIVLPARAQLTKTQCSHSTVTDGHPDLCSQTLWGPVSVDEGLAQTWIGLQDVRARSLLFLQLVVQAFPLQTVFGKALELVVEWMVLESFDLFSLDEDFLLFSGFQRLDVGSLLHFGNGIGFRCTQDCS